MTVHGEVNDPPLVIWNIGSTFTIRSELNLIWFPFDSQDFLFTVSSKAMPTSKIQLFADSSHDPLNGCQKYDNFDITFVGASGLVCCEIHIRHP